MSVWIIIAAIPALLITLWVVFACVLSSRMNRAIEEESPQSVAHRPSMASRSAPVTLQ